MASDKFLTERKRVWDNAATVDAKFYVIEGVDGRREWELGDFFKSGKNDVEEFVLPFLQHMHMDPSTKSMIEIGCGVGRVTHALSQVFNHITAFDISKEMIRKAKELNADLSNVNFVEGNGASLQPLKNSTVDFCFSYLVFTHFPKYWLFEDYFSEFARVLKPGGLFKIELDGRAWGPYLIPRALYNRLVEIDFIRSRLAPLLFFWLDQVSLRAAPGLHFSEGAIRSLVTSANLEVVSVENPNQHRMWVTGRKPEGE
ncbi:MAG: ubiquinone/menaquinone biosynthesis C-methylase UbiE [Gammaproteobacteria bacterium]|jgi:ubiquinone/menaquinone biosynthesis C-methylase UbiE